MCQLLYVVLNLTKDMSVKNTYVHTKYHIKYTVKSLLTTI